jgi:glyoxylase-like metal-dependent hydrolase (beta-lactamase superfamily II)
MWQAKKIFDNYDLRNEFFALTSNLSVNRGLTPNETFSWQGLKIRVLGTPGHTEGSLTYLANVGGRTLAFCGDLISSPGHVPTIHDMEWKYVGAAGFAAEMSSLNMLRQYAPDLVLPSHGTPTFDALNSFPTLISKLAEIHDEYNWYQYTVRQPMTGITRMSPHLWHVRSEQNGTSYVLLSDSGHAFVWDANKADPDYVAEIQKVTGFKELDAIAISHYHDDHVGGVNEIKRRFGAPVWAMKHMADVLEHPNAYNLPCLFPEPIHVDRVLEDRESILWREYKLQFFYLPGQTEYSEGMLVSVDGKRLLFNGDNISYSVPGRAIQGHYVCRNYQRLDGGHVYSARKYIELAPEFVVPNHFEWVRGTSDALNSYLVSSEKTNQAMMEIVDQPDPMFGVDPNWLSVYPYQVEANPGDVVDLAVRFRNWMYTDATTDIVFQPVTDWTFEPSALTLTAFAKSQTSGHFSLHVPRNATRNHRYAIALDVTRDGQHLGEVAEFLVNVLPMRSH